MSQRRIEEVYKSIAPARSRGVPQMPVLSEGLAADGNLSTSLGQATSEIAQLRAAWQRQAELITANTQAVQNSTSSAVRSVASTAGHAATSLLGGFGLISPIISGLKELFGGGTKQPEPLTFYTAPPAVGIDATLRSAPAPAAQPIPPALFGTSAQPFMAGVQATSMMTAPAQSAAKTESPASPSEVRPGGTGASIQTTYSPQITVNVSAMDSQSFMDRSADIASAVREAMLNNHPINGVVADL